jgi:hypothetical protein
MNRLLQAFSLQPNKHTSGYRSTAAGAIVVVGERRNRQREKKIGYRLLHVAPCGCPINPRHLDFQLRFPFPFLTSRHLIGQPHVATCRSTVPNFFPRRIGLSTHNSARSHATRGELMRPKLKHNARG